MADARHSRESRRAEKKGKKNWFELVVEGRFRTANRRTATYILGTIRRRRFRLVLIAGTNCLSPRSSRCRNTRTYSLLRTTPNTLGDTRHVAYDDCRFRQRTDKEHSAKVCTDGVSWVLRARNTRARARARENGGRCHFVAAEVLGDLFLRTRDTRIIARLKSHGDRLRLHGISMSRY